MHRSPEHVTHVSATLGNDRADCLKPLRDLLLQRLESTPSVSTLQDVNSKNFAGLRDDLVALGPLDVDWIKKASKGFASGGDLVLHTLLTRVIPHYSSR